MSAALSGLSSVSRRLGNCLATYSGALVCGIFLVVGLGVLDDYGVSWDEGIRRRPAHETLRAIVSGDETVLPTNRKKILRLGL